MALWVGAADFDHTHAALNRLLAQHVNEGWVNYGTLDEQRHQLSAYAKSLAQAPVQSFSRDQQLAFWINAYNAFTLQLILEHKPKRSIRDINGAWDKYRFTAGGRALTLNQIEHEIIRKQFNEPLIHMVLVCAAKSCPILESQAFTATDLRERLQQAARRFARDRSKNRYLPKEKKLVVSKIFEWYGDDFVSRYAAGGNKLDAIRGYFSTFLNEPLPSDLSVTYGDYDWRLNGTW